MRSTLLLTILAAAGAQNASTFTWTRVNASFASPSEETERRLCAGKTITKNVIIETDFTADIDDVAALAIAHKLADQCHWRIIAIMYNEKNSECPPAIHAINQWYGRDDIPVGVWGGGFNNVEDSAWCPYVRTYQEDGSKNYGLDKYPGWFSSDLNNEYNSIVAKRNYNAVTEYQVQYSLDVYSNVLSNAADGSVTIVSIGYTEDLNTLIHNTDALKALWKSKIGNMYLMGGSYNLDNSNNHGFNQDSIDLYNDWSKPIITTCDGGDMRIGLNQTMIDDINQGRYTSFTSVSPTKRAFFYHCGMGWAQRFCHQNDDQNQPLLGRRSWDPFTVVLAAKDIGATGDSSGVWTAANNGNFGCFPSGFDKTYFYLGGVQNSDEIRTYMEELYNEEPSIAAHV